MTFGWVGQAWLGVPLVHGTAMMSPVIWIGWIGFAVVAAWFDIRERRIPNGLNVLGLVFFLTLHVILGSVTGALFAFVSVGVLMLVPTLLGLWGQGDWKMAMVGGAALGVLPALLVWWLGLVLAKIFSIAARKFGIRWLRIEVRNGLPVAVFVLMGSSLLYCFVP